MKNFLVIVVLGLLLNGNVVAKKISSYDDLDLTSKPKKVLSKSDTKSLWNAYKIAPKCFEHPTYGKGIGYKLKKISKNKFKKNTWTSPFYKYEENNKHEIYLPLTLPQPIITVDLNEDYGERQSDADSAIEFFQKAAYVGRVGNSVEEIEKIKTVILIGQVIML